MSTLFGAVIEHLFNHSEVRTFQVWWITLSLIIVAQPLPPSLTTNIVIGYCWQLSLLAVVKVNARNSVKWDENAPKYGGVLEKLSMQQCCAWLAILMIWMDPSCFPRALLQTLHYLVSELMPTVMDFLASKSDTVQLTQLLARSANTWTIRLICNHMESCTIWE